MESLGENLETMPRVPLADEHVAKLHEIGTERSYEAGEMVAEIGDTVDVHCLIHEGEKNAFKFSGIGATRMGPAAIQRFMRQQAFLIKKGRMASPWWHSLEG